MAISVSVIIPCFNSARYLRETVESIWAQTYQDIEIILIDDGSTDETSMLIFELINTENKCQMQIMYQTNAGVAAARNSGIALAQGEYILPLDADDLIHPSMLADCLSIFNSQNDVLLVYTDRQDFGDNAQYRDAGIFELARLKYFNQISYCGLYRKCLWGELGGYKSNVSGFDDWDFWIAAALNGAKAYHLPKAYLLHRRHKDSQFWHLLSRYEELYARIILNNVKAFSDSEQTIAREFLNRGTSASLLSSTRFIFLGQYYAGYPQRLNPTCVS
jgi:glycosyltransferase involved in cell wall biosynthesis